MVDLGSGEFRAGIISIGMEQSIETFNPDDTERITALRNWVAGHFDDPTAYDTVDGKLRLIRTLLENAWIKRSETWKLQSLGIAFGDALEQDVEELTWVVVDDEYGRDPALRWLDTAILSFPLTAISKRVEGGTEVDVLKLFRAAKKTIRKSVTDAA